MLKQKLIGRGRTADVHCWGEDQVLKLYLARIPRSLVESEFQVTQAAHLAGLPVPATEKIVEVDGRIGIVFERIEGVSLLKILERQPWRLFSISRMLAELHGMIHARSGPANLPSQHDRIAYLIRITPDLSDTAKESILQYLETLPDGTVFCHGDFHPDNILWTKQGPIIIDWMTGSRGDPTADIARTSLLFRSGSLPPHIPFQTRIAIRFFRNAMHRIYLRRYGKLFPTRKIDLQAWELPLLASRLIEVGNFPAERVWIMERIMKVQTNRRSPIAFSMDREIAL
jgi:uncharacterized protein (TIGR02172 family)